MAVTHHHERCGRCAHPNDHEGKPCAREVRLVGPDGEKGEPTICGCPYGVRSDVFANQQLANISKSLDAIGQLLFELREVTLAAHSLEINEEGEIRHKPRLVGL